MSMGAVDDILRRAKRLKRNDLSRLVKELDAHLSSVANGSRAEKREIDARRTRSARSKTTTKRTKDWYTRTLALSGIARSGASDVSSNKGKYLAEAYMPRRDE